MLIAHSQLGYIDVDHTLAGLAFLAYNNGFRKLKASCSILSMQFCTQADIGLAILHMIVGPFVTIIIIIMTRNHDLNRSTVRTLALATML